MKASRDIKVFADDGLILEYNTLSGALANLNPKQYNKVEHILTQYDKIQNNAVESDSNLSSLANGRFLIDDNVNELDLLKTRKLLGKFKQDRLGVTIMPTLNCKSRRIYCFKEHKNQTISLNFSENLLEWVRFPDAASSAFGSWLVWR